MTRIKITDAHDNEHEIEGEDIQLSVEGITTLVIKPDKSKDSGWDILGSFINVAAAIKETE